MDSLLALNGPSYFANMGMLLALIPYNHIDVLTSSKAVKTTDKGVLVNTEGSGKREIEADPIVLAVEYNYNKELYNSLKYEIPDIRLLGDARKVSNIMYAIWDAYEVVSNL
ncbi:hypothetical protein [Clostridium autoethanogenum]|uniref:Uncharacterized protein n=1 Tax=Clostridium autoethanogenum DSM 10061 TaxID=1341692 RepID=A0ABM5NXA1_9CLOT|nr:hypothetical protein [Clostridium autoethanogenum]AGY77118.1 hypothetical protein CAETHG_2913 [Clostridium autoethanogenum DSM 10061]ALU37260.1 Hypothetical protein CLAU_2833 [Clostridium autoethanogenum DSM 10061]OVY50172.1 2-enoate reductase FldZ [Clostridium autoethanogenum]